jgi:hypothetical protein
VRAVQAMFRLQGGDYGAFCRVVAMGWLPLDGQSFNVVLGIFLPRAAVAVVGLPEEVERVDEAVGGEPEVLSEFEDVPLGWGLPDHVQSPRSSGTMVNGATIVAGRPRAPPDVRDGDCPVCLDRVALLAIVPCGHMVCADCWAGCRDRCPLCRCGGTGLELRWP